MRIVRRSCCKLSMSDGCGGARTHVANTCMRKSKANGGEADGTLLPSLATRVHRTSRGQSICSATRSRREPPRHSSWAISSESFWTLSSAGPGAKPRPMSFTTHLFKRKD